ncbi:MAG: tyrosine-type recombinase/integrase [Armatimonadota bacterium]
MGSIQKRKNIYYAVFDGPRGLDGKRKQVWKSCPYMNKKEAQVFLQEEERKVRLGTYIVHDQTLAAYLQEWLRHVEATIAATSLREYRSAVGNHLIPALGPVPLGQLTSLQIQQLYTKLLETRAPKTVKNIHGVLHGALGQAVRWQLLARNPCEAVNPPKVLRPQIQVAGRDELWQVLDALKGRDWYLPTLIALATGMRRGEVLGLQWQDFDEEGPALIVRRALARVRDSNVVIKDTKSGRTRVVALPNVLLQALRDHKQQSAHTAPTDWICGKADGQHLAPGGLSLAFRRAAQQQGLSISFHSIRHTQATTLMSSGVPVKVVSERLGHANVQITQDTYAHVLPHMQREAADVVGRTLMHPDDSEDVA